jgi:hypothetical protein
MGVGAPIRSRAACLVGVGGGESVLTLRGTVHSLCQACRLHDRRIDNKNGRTGTHSEGAGFDSRHLDAIGAGGAVTAAAGGVQFKMPMTSACSTVTQARC